MQKVLKILPFLSLGVLALGVLIILYWLFSFPSQAFITKNPIPVSDVTADSVTLRYDYCKNVSVKGRTVTSLVGSDVQLGIPVTSEKSPKGCGKIDKTVPIPPQARPGKYHYHFRTTYQVNPLKSVIQDLDSESFEIE